MIQPQALKKAKILAFAEKHGIAMALEAFEVRRRTFFEWKRKWTLGGRAPEALNEKSRAPKAKRKRLWDTKIIAEIKRLRFDYPNLGKEKLFPELLKFCMQNGLSCPKPKTIGRLIQDLGGLRVFPAKISHFGKIKPAKRRNILRKPSDFKAEYPGHCVALDTIEKHVWGRRYYVITFEDLFTRFSFAWETTSHASLAAKEFFLLCLKVFPFPIAFVLTDNGSEFMKHFDEELRRLHMIHYHTYPKTPKMNAHRERFNRTIQEEFVDYNSNLLANPNDFNRKLVDWLIWYNTDRVHYAFQNKLSPVQFMLQLPQQTVAKMSTECKSGWPYTFLCHL
ncbi:transposase [Candidatus Wolfebacteria bacterium]|nr:transposase [Candidatus Wolfebacteria bacterium]